MGHGVIPKREAADYALSIELGQSEVSVSYMSSLLRTVQAALREVALDTEGAREQLGVRPQPVLVMQRLEADRAITMSFVFEDPLEGEPMADLSSRTFESFLDRLGAFVMSLPQRSLWGGASRRLSQALDSGVSRRMDQVYAELRRAPKATLRVGRRSLEIEGDRLEVG